MLTIPVGAALAAAIFCLLNLSYKGSNHVPIYLLFPLFLLLLRGDAKRRVEFEDGGDGKAEHPLVVLEEEHEEGSHHEQQGGQYLLTAEATDDEVAALVSVEQLRYGE